MMSDRGNIRVRPLAPQCSPHDPLVSHNRQTRNSIHSAKGFQWFSDALSVVYQPTLSLQSRRCLPVMPTHSAQRTDGLQGYDSGRMAGLLDLLSYDTRTVGAVAASATVALVWWDKRKARRSYPPGPKGNYFDWPKGKIWEGFTWMAEDHGEQGVILSFGKLLIRIL